MSQQELDEFTEVCAEIGLVANTVNLVVKLDDTSVSISRREPMEVIYPRCAGLDVHKKTVVAYWMHTKANGHKEQETRTFGTTTRELLRLLAWLQEKGCTQVAIEGTGVYVKSIPWRLQWVC